MKKYVVAILVLIMIVGCGKKEVTTNYDRVEGIVEINYQELNEKLSTETDFLVYIGRPDCGDCQVFYPYLEDYVKTTGKGIYYLNVKKFRDDSKKEGATQEEIDFFTNLQKNLDFDWTPTLQHYQNGKIIDRYTFLDLDYYSISDEAQKQTAFDDFVAKFKAWMDKNVQTKS